MAPSPIRRAQAVDEEGFILIEVLVSAVILALVAGAVLALITATTRSAASARNHSTAYALAQADQARLRELPIAKLNRLDEPRTETVGGTTFTVESKGVFVNNTTGTPSCTEANSSADYVEVSSTVSGPGLLHPVSLESIVSPTSGSLDPSHGTLAVQVNNAAGEGVSGVSVRVEGSRTVSGSTESDGCANFADLPNGNYKVTATGNGLITTEGKETWTKEQVGVPAAGVQQLLIHFDHGGTIAPQFVYKEPGTGTLRPAPVDSMEIYNAESGLTASTFGTPGGVRSSTLTDGSVYPFKTKYTVYAGSCTSNNPDPEGKKPENDIAIGFAEVLPEGTASPQIQVPALEVNVTNNGGVVTGARVTVTDTKCKSGSANVKRTYVTNAGGHLSSSTTGATEAGLPFGTYNVCASAVIGGAYRRAEALGVRVESPTTGTTLNLALSAATSACP